MEKIIIPAGEVEGTVDPPSSKSYAQRAVAAALLAQGRSVLSCVEMCDDTMAALRVVQTLGAQVRESMPGTFEIDGLSASDCGGEQPLTLDIGESGLSTRLFTPIAALRGGQITIVGHGSILRRPMEMMLEPLRLLGVQVTDNQGFLPITVSGPMAGGEVEIDGGVSSQFLTGLLISLPLAERDTTVRVRRLRSIPYVDMTIDVMRRFGVEVDHRDYDEFYIPGNQQYKPTKMRIEGDWSAASCMLVAGATAGSVTVQNLNPVSLQADVAIIEALSRAGAHIDQTTDSVTVTRRKLRAFEFDATDCPDLFPALAALAAACEGSSTIVGTSRLTHKESNRARSIASEFGKLGIDVDLSTDDVMRIRGGFTNGGADILEVVEVDSMGDHRMAMSLAVTALRASHPVKILGAECVSKSYSDFWNDYEQLRK